MTSLKIIDSFVKEYIVQHIAKMVQMKIIFWMTN